MDFQTPAADRQVLLDELAKLNRDEFDNAALFLEVIHPYLRRTEGVEPPKANTRWHRRFAELLMAFSELQEAGIIVTVGRTPDDMANVWKVATR